MIPEFSIAVRLTHFFNFLFLSLLVRSGIEILGAHPKLYWRGGQGDGATTCSTTIRLMPGSDWHRCPNVRTFTGVQERAETLEVFKTSGATSEVCVQARHRVVGVNSGELQVNVAIELLEAFLARELGICRAEQACEQ